VLQIFFWNFLLFYCDILGFASSNTMKAFKNAKFKKERKVISMKKIRKILAVLASVMIITATSIVNASAEYIPSYVAPEDVVSVAETYPDVKTLDELKKVITEVTPIYYEEYYSLRENITPEELYNYFVENDIGEKEAETLVESYYEGLKQIIEDKTIVLIYPEGQEPELPEYNPGPAVPMEYLTETSGTFEGGVTYCFNEETRGLIFDGKGELAEADFCKATSSFGSIDFIFFGNDVTLECHHGARSTAFLFAYVENWYNLVERPSTPTFTYEGSEYTKQFEKYVEETGALEGQFIYYTVEDGTDPYTFVNPLPELPSHFTDGGLLWDAEKASTSPWWHYEGTVYNGVSEGFLLIETVYNEPYTLEDVLNVIGDYTVTEVHFGGGTDMSVLPEELQNCKTLEEAEAELLKLINEAKEDEQPIEETTEATVPTEVTEPTEIVEEKTAETIAESVVILADEITTEQAASVNESMTDEKITDLKEIEGLIKDFINEENLSSYVGIDVLYDTEGNEINVVSVMTYYWESDRIKDFIAEKNIDNNKVIFFTRMLGLVDSSTTHDESEEDVLIITVRDAALIARYIANNNADELPEAADYNKDGKINIRDAAAIAKNLAENK